MSEHDMTLRSFFSFLLDDVSEANIGTKCQDLTRCLIPELIPGLLDYLINNLIIYDASRVEVFAEVLLQLSGLFSEIYNFAIPLVVRTIKTIFLHLPAVNTTSIEEYLKNLGRFLGFLTLVRGRLVIDGVFDMKSLLLEAIDKGNPALIYVVPFLSSFFKCVAISGFPIYCTYNTRILKVLSLVHRTEGVDQKVKFEIEELFKVLKAKSMELGNASNICSSPKRLYIGFDNDLHTNKQSLLPWELESTSGKVPDRNVIALFQTLTAQNMLPSVGQSVRKQMPVNVFRSTSSTLNFLRSQVTDGIGMDLQKNLTPLLSSHPPSEILLSQSSNSMQQLPGSQSSQFDSTRQPLHQQMPLINHEDNCGRQINYDEILSTLNIQEAQETLESQHNAPSLHVDHALLREANRFLSRPETQFLMAFAVIKFIVEATRSESKRVAINSITNSVINAITRNGIPENLLKVVKSKTSEITFSHVRQLMKGTFNTLFREHVMILLHNFGHKNPFIGEFVTEFVQKQSFDMLYPHFLNDMYKEALEDVKKQLFAISTRRQPESQSHSSIGCFVHSSLDPSRNAHRVEMPQNVPTEQSVLSNTQQHRTQMHLNHPQDAVIIALPSQSGNTSTFGKQERNIMDLVTKIYDKQMADSEVQEHLQHKRICVYPNSPLMKDLHNMSLRRGTDALTSAQLDTIDSEQHQVQFVCYKLLDFIDKIMPIASSGHTLTMLSTIKQLATDAVTHLSSAKVTIWGSIVCCITSSFLKCYTASNEDAVNEDQKHIYLFTLKYMCNLTRAEFVQAAVFTGWYFEVELERKKGDLLTPNASIWNWKAFAELFRQQLVDLDMFDQCLSVGIERNFIDYVEFFLNLLDHFILPEAFETKSSEIGKDGTKVLSTNCGLIKVVEHKRDFMALNEFDLWKSIRSFVKLQMSIPIAGDFVRIHTSYARIRALMDWGLFESDEVQEKFSLDNIEYQPLFKEISKSKLRNRWSEDKGKLHCVFNTWYGFYSSSPSISRNTLACMAQCMKPVFPNGSSEKEEDVIDFFRALIDEIVDTFTVDESGNLRTISFEERDELSRRSEAFGEFLAISILTASTLHSKINKLKLLCHFLGSLGRKIIFMHELSKGVFDSLPFKHILMRLYRTLLATQRDSLLKPIMREPVPVVFGYLLHLLRPSRVPAFQEAFLEFLGSDVFMISMLGVVTLAHHNIYAQLLVDVTKHVSILAQYFITRNSFTNLYQSLHDLWNKVASLYPTFVCGFAHYFSNFLSLPLFDLRNLVISTRNAQATFTGILEEGALKSRLDSLPDPTGYVMQAHKRLPSVLKSAVESYFSVGAPLDLLEALPYVLQASDSIVHMLQSPTKPVMAQDEFGQNSIFHKALHHAAINVQNLTDYGFTNSLPYIPDLVSDFLVYLCIVSVENCQYLGDDAGEYLMERLPLMEIVKSLLKAMGNAGQYFIISCMVNQLRYLNKHTKFFAQYLIQIFKLAAKDEDLRCDIFRCLFEYLLTREPKSEGILLTCAEIFREFESNSDDSEVPKLSNDLERAVRKIFMTYIPAINPEPPRLSKSALYAISGTDQI